MREYVHPEHGRPLASQTVHLWRYQGNVWTLAVSTLDMATRRLVAGPEVVLDMPCGHNDCLLVAAAAELTLMAEVEREERQHAGQPELPLDWSGLV